MTKNVKNVKKKRNWAFVCYPESLPDNWLEILQKTGLKIAISPLHDKDKDPDEKEKKAHYHVIMCWDGPVSYRVALGVAKSVNGTNPIQLEQVRGYYRYFTHRDNPEKYQYDEKDIKCLNGFSIMDFVDLTRSEISQIRQEIRELIHQNSIMEYCELIDFLDILGNAQYIEVAETNTLHFNAYLRSKQCKRFTIISTKKDIQND